MGIQRSLSMLGSAVSSSTPNDFQPNSHIGVLGSRPLMNRHAWKAPSGLAYAAVGMHRALDSAIGLPSRSTSASRMLVFLMPAEVRRNLMMPPSRYWGAGRERAGASIGSAARRAASTGLSGGIGPRGT